MDSHPIQPKSTSRQSAAVDRLRWMLVPAASSGGHEPIVAWPLPFRIGRRQGCVLQLNSKAISGHHAELHQVDDQLWVTDLNSTNGTYVNGKRIDQPTELNDTALLQLADIAFRVDRDRHELTFATINEEMCDDALALVQFDRLMENRLVTPFFQSIVDLRSGAPLGYEVLARSQVFGLESSYAMFNVASQLNMEVVLSAMLRWEGIREGLNLPDRPTLFVNTHPHEIRTEGLVSSLANVKQLSSDMRIVLEVHEAAITDPKEMVELRDNLKALGIGIAYDDFSSGQTRLTELIEAQPDYLKFDTRLIKNIDKASLERQRTLESLVKMALDLGVNPLAVGVETAAEADVCRKMGFKAAQGYHFGRPAPVRSFQ